MMWRPGIREIERVDVSHPHGRQAVEDHMPDNVLCRVHKNVELAKAASVISLLNQHSRCLPNSML